MNTTAEEQERMIQMCRDGMKLVDIVKASGRCMATVKSVLRKAGLVQSGKFNDSDVLWIRRHFPGRNGWKIPKPVEVPGKYRKVHPGDVGIRTPSRPDGKFQ